MNNIEERFINMIKSGKKFDHSFDVSWNVTTWALKKENRSAKNLGWAALATFVAAGRGLQFAQAELKFMEAVNE
jgi:hypothetical protein